MKNHSPPPPGIAPGMGSYCGRRPRAGTRISTVPFRRWRLLVALLVLTTLTSGATMAWNDRVAAREGQPDSIGTATMLSNGTIVLDLRPEGPGGMIGDARLTYRPGEPHYPAVRDHLPGLRAGMTVMVPPLD